MNLNVVIHQNLKDTYSKLSDYIHSPSSVTRMRRWPGHPCPDQVVPYVGELVSAGVFVEGGLEAPDLDGLLHTPFKPIVLSV